ncbi:MAG: cysteine--tRNA ligase [Cytophagales bacterium]|nr:cysteine--tRNA ligase [Cytophagales bacterium]
MLDKKNLREGLSFYNTISRKKEKFVPLNPGRVGLYVCGPTVYGPVHLGNVRTFLVFDVLYRYLRWLGFQVKYVRNITDVGHLLHDADEGEDKVAIQARKEGKHPMELADHYTRYFEDVMQTFKLHPPNISPTATGHLIEQQGFIEKLSQTAYAYSSHGSVYFDIHRYAKDYSYGSLSGNKLEEQKSLSRPLQGSSAKQAPEDFALWKKADPNHIMRWPSPWSDGFPGWHTECVVMSQSYLGLPFDIHGGGMDLIFPHHECELAQSLALTGNPLAQYWLHANMVVFQNKKMSRSEQSTLPALKDFEDLRIFPHPEAFRMLVSQAHYRSTLDLSETALISAQKTYLRLINGLKTLKSFQTPRASTPQEDLERKIKKACEGVWQAMNDDLNTAVALSHVFDILSYIRAVEEGQATLKDLSPETHTDMKNTYIACVEEILGFSFPQAFGSSELPDTRIDLLLRLYVKNKQAKDYDSVEIIRAYFKAHGISFQERRDGTLSWKYT